MFIIIANQFISNKITTGGDVLFIEICKRIKQRKVFLVPEIITPEISKLFGDSVICITDHSRKISGASTLIGGMATVIKYLYRSLTTTYWLVRNAKKTDIIYLSGDFFCDTIPAYLCKRLNPDVRVFANFYHRNPKSQERQGNPSVISKFSRFSQTISLHLIKFSAEKVFVLSNTGAEELNNFGIDKNKIVVSGAGVNKSPLKNNRKIRNQILYLGRINNTKGVFELIEILSDVIKRIPSAVLILAGNGSANDIARLRRLIKMYKLDNNVEYLGYVDDDRKTKLLSESTVLVLPSKEEGFGIVIVEALAHRTQAICYDLNALKTIYQDTPNVIFVKSFNKSEFANKIIRCLTLKKINQFGKIQTWDDVFKKQSKYFYTE